MVAVLGKQPDGRVQPPVVGRFTDAAGTFCARETYNWPDALRRPERPETVNARQ